MCGRCSAAEIRLVGHVPEDQTPLTAYPAPNRRRRGTASQGDWG
jgi:hypothetical protein